MVKFLKHWEESTSEEGRDQILQQGINKLQDNIYRQELEEQLAKRHSVSRSSSAKYAMLKWGPILAVAASILVLLFAVPYLLNKSDVQQTASIYLKQDVMTHPGVIKGTDQSISGERDAAISNYVARRFDEAAEHFAAIRSPTREDRFFHAMALIYSEKYSDAIPHLRALKEERQTSYGQEINWFLSLALIRSDRLGEATSVLQDIKATDWHGDEAHTLLAEIAEDTARK